MNSLGAGPQNDSLALEAALKDPRLEQPVQITRKNDLTLPAMHAALKSAFSGADGTMCPSSFTAATGRW